MRSRLAMFRYKPNGDRIQQEELAKTIGCSRDWIVKAEKGRLGRTAELMIRLSHAMNRDLREIFLLEDKLANADGGDTDADGPET